MKSSELKLLVIGLDGATLDVVLPLVEQGCLPHLKKMIEAGSCSPLSSIIPPVTGPAWSALATGLNPGRLGIFDFVNRRQVDDLRLYPIRSSDFAGRAFWDILSSTGLRIGVFNYPMLVPAYPINGWMVGGLGASKLHEFTYPVQLKSELERVTGGYQITVSYGLPKYRHNLPRLVADLKKLLDIQLVALEHLLATRPVDALVAVFTISDVASHTLWGYWQTDGRPESGDPFHQAMREEFIAIWQALDRAVGLLLERLTPGGHALIVSDHGFGPSRGVFHVNAFLQQAGYLVPRRASTAAGNQLRSWLVEKSTPFLGTLYKRLAGSKVHGLLRASILREIDLDDSRAFALESEDLCAGIYLNHRYARLRDLDVDDFLRRAGEDITRDLHLYARNNALEFQVYRSQELYSGEKAALAPEILLAVNNFLTSVSYRLGQPIYTDRPHRPLKTGNHRLNGVLIATGPRILPGSLNARLMDIAPTILHLMDVPVPATIDGRALLEMLEPEFRHLAAPVSGEQSSGASTVPEPDEAPSEMLQRLKDLGYLD